MIAGIVLVLAHLGSAAPVAASPSFSHHHAPLAVSVAPPFAATVTWHGFVNYWKGFVHRSDRVDTVRLSLTDFVVILAPELD